MRTMMGRTSIVGWNALMRAALTLALAMTLACKNKGGGNEDENADDENTDEVVFSVSITSPEADFEIDPTTDDSDFTLSGECSPDGRKVTLVLDEEQIGKVDCIEGGWEFGFDSTALENGEHTLAASLQDESAEVSFTRSVPVPEIALNPADDISSFNEGTYTVSGSCSPNGSDVDVAVDSVDDSTTCTGGEFSVELDVSGIADGADIEVSAELDAGFSLIDTDSALIDKDTTVGVTLDAAADVTAANETAYGLSGTCTPDTSTVTIDFGALDDVATTTCGATTAGAWDVTVDVSAEADGDPITVSATLDNGVGGTTNTNALVTKDATSPAITMDAAPDVNAANEASYTVTGTCVSDGDIIAVDFDASMGVAVVACGATTSGLWSASFDASGFADAVGYTVAATITDGFNPNAMASDTVDKDTTLSAINLSSAPLVNDANKGAYTVSGTCYPDTALVTLDFGALTDVGSTTCGATVSGEFSITADVSAEGDNAAVTVLVDIDDTVTTDDDSTSVIKDTGVPSVTLNAPTDMLASNVSAYTFDGTCDDATATLTLTVDGSDFAGSCDGANWSITDDFSAIDDGLGLAISVSLLDDAGNEGTDAGTLDKDTALPPDASTWTLDPVSGSTSTDFSPQIFDSGISDEDGTLIELYEEDTCTVLVDSDTIAGGSFLMNGITYATDGSDDGLHTYWAVTTDSLGNERPCFATNLSYTLDSPGLASQPALALIGDGDDDANIVALEDDTEFTYTSADGMTTVDYGPLAAGTVTTISNTSQGDTLDIAEGAVMGMTRIGSIAMPWATLGYAGNNFVYNVRNGQSSARIIIAAVSGDADVDIQLTSGGSANPLVLDGDVHEEVLSGLSGETGVVITSDAPIVVGAYSGSGIDNMLLSAVGLDMLAVGYVRATEDNTTVNRYHAHGPFTEGIVLTSSGDSTTAGNLNNSLPIGSTVARVTSDKLVSCYDRADGDGSDGVSGINTSYLATHYALPEDSDYVVVMALQDGDVTITQPAGTPAVQDFYRDGSANALAPYYIADGGDLVAGTTLVCDVPCAIVYDSLSGGDEEFLLGFTP